MRLPAIFCALLLVCISACSDSDSGDSSGSNNSSTASQTQPPATPTPKPVTRAELKREFLATVDESISGAMIADSPYKYVGKHVDLHCTVSDVVGRHNLILVVVTAIQT